MRTWLGFAMIWCLGCAREAPRPPAAPPDRYAGTWEGRSVVAGSEGGATWRLALAAAAGKATGVLSFAGPDTSALAVRTIELSDSGIVFEIGPYRDPQPNAEVITRFEGRVSGDSLAGTFVMLPTKGGGVVPDMSVEQWHNAVARPAPGSEPIRGKFTAVRRFKAP